MRQDILRHQKVGVIGAGEAGSLVVEYLARLGVGHLVVADPDRLELSNVPRVVGSTRRDAVPRLTAPDRPAWMRRVGAQWSRRKTHIAVRVARQANPRITVEKVNGDIADDSVTQRFTDCDYLFLAADSMRARLVFNALVHQYLILGAQVGAKVTVENATGEILDVFSVYRSVLPGIGCLWCNGLISPSRLQEEALTETERHQQRYIDESTIHAPASSPSTPSPAHRPSMTTSSPSPGCSRAGQQTPTAASFRARPTSCSTNHAGTRTAPNAATAPKDGSVPGPACASPRA